MLGTLSGPGGTLHLEPKVMNVLVCLAELAGDVVTHDQFIARVWRGRIVSDEVLSRCISLLRTRLGDDPREPRYIQTVPKIGYRLLTPVEPLTPSPAQPTAAPQPPAAIDPELPVAAAPRRIRPRLVVGGTILGLLLLAAAGYLYVDRGPRRAAPPVAGEPTIAVLPFVNRSDDKDNEYFSDGLTEEIISDLSHVRSLRVISRTSAMQLRGSGKNIKVLGRELDVRYVLEGSVRKAGNDLRITVRLVDAVTDTPLWSGKYPGVIAEVFDIQERVSRAVVDALRLKLAPEENRAIARRSFDDPRAFECYLRAKQEVWRARDDSLERTLGQLQDGLAIVGPNALLYGVMGQAHLIYAHTVIGVMQEHVDKAEKCGLEALALDADSAQAHIVLGIVRLKRRDIAGALRHFERARAADPNNPDVLFWIAFWYGELGRQQDVTEAVQVLSVIDPLSANTHWARGWAHLLDGRADAAVEPLRKAYDLSGESPFFEFFLAHALASTGRAQDAIDLLRRNVTGSRENIWTCLNLWFMYALEGDRAGASAVVNERLYETVTMDETYGWVAADCAALLGQVDEAVHWLSVASELSFTNYPFLSERDVLLESVRHDSRFVELMSSVRERWERVLDWRV
jgi:non-specific serine/threonine protein kinase